MEQEELARGRYFEDFEVGEEVSGPGRTVTEADVVAFAGVSGDYNQIHTDAEFARSTPFGARIAHGLLGLSMASGLGTRAGLGEGTVIAFLGLDWKFKAVILIGDTLWLRVGVSKKRRAPSMGGGIVVLDVSLLNQRGETVQEGTWKMLIKSRPSS
jgi:acyl dehydratase